MHKPRAIRHLLFATAITTVASASPACAYSDQAVKDAERVVQLMTQRRTYGTAGDWEVAIARYTVLEMKYRAKSISEAAFCTSAKAELMRAAGSHAPDADPAAMQKWRAAVAGMDRDRAKCREAAALTPIVAAGAAPADESSETVDEARHRVDTIEQRVPIGTASQYDLADARYRLAGAEYRAGAIDLAAYCERAVAAGQEMAAIMTARLNDATVSELETFPAKRALDAAQAKCAGISRPAGAQR